MEGGALKHEEYGGMKFENLEKPPYPKKEKSIPFSTIDTIMPASRFDLVTHSH